MTEFPDELKAILVSWQEELTLDRRYVSDEDIANGMIGIAQDALTLSTPYVELTN